MSFTNCHFKILYLIAFMIICNIFLYIYCILWVLYTAHFMHPDKGHLGFSTPMCRSMLIFAFFIRSKGTMYTFMSVRQVKYSSCSGSMFIHVYSFSLLLYHLKTNKKPAELELPWRNKYNTHDPRGPLQFLRSSQQTWHYKTVSFWPDQLSFQSTDEKKQA